MPEIDFISSIHSTTKRDYIGRVCDKEFPKHHAARLAKKWGMTIGMVTEELTMEGIIICLMDVGRL